MIWWIGIFIVDLIVAFAWANSVKAISEGKAVKAGLWAGFITFSAAVSIISYNENNLLLIPATLGGAFGTYLSVKSKKYGS